MTPLELTLATLAATLWLLGAWSTYAGIMIVRPMAGRLAQVVTLLIWPFVVLWVVFTSKRASHAGG